jgi:hypothetical protein
MEIIMKADRIHKTLPRTRPAWVYMPALYGVAFEWRCGVARCIAEFLGGMMGGETTRGKRLLSYIGLTTAGVRYMYCKDKR